MSATKFACPQCRQVLRSSVPIAAGKKFRCPKCEHVFSLSPEESAKTYAFQDEPARPTPPARPPRAQRDDEPAQADFDDDVADFEDDEEEFDRPRRKFRPKPKKSKSAGLLVGLIVGAILIVVLAGGAGGVYWFLNRDKNSSKNEDPLVYIPADSLIVAKVEFGSLMNQPTVGKWLEDAGKGGFQGNSLESIKKETGLEFKDLFSSFYISLGSSSPQAVLNPAAQKFTIVGKSRIPFNQLKMRDSFKEPTAVRYEGRTYFKVKEGQLQFAYMPSNHILVLTSMPENELQSLIRAEKAPPAELPPHMELARTIQTNHFWGVVKLDGGLRETIQEGIRRNPTAQPNELNLATALGQANAAGFWGMVEEDAVSFTLGVACSDSKSAKQIAGAAKGIWNRELQSSGPEALLGALFMPKGMQELQKELKTVSFFSEESLAQATGRFNLRNLESVVSEFQRMGVQSGRGGAGFPQPGARPGQRPGGRPKAGVGRDTR